MAAAAEQRTVEYAKERLEEWGQWVRNLKGVHLGYALSSIHDRVDNDDGDLDDSGNERAEEVERIMCRLSELRPTTHRALVQWYLVRNPQSIASDACRCSERVFRDRVRLGEMFVAGRLLG